MSPLANLQTFEMHPLRFNIASKATILGITDASTQASAKAAGSRTKSVEIVGSDASLGRVPPSGIGAAFVTMPIAVIMSLYRRCFRPDRG